MTAAAPEAVAVPAKPALSVEDLHELIGAYNGITEKLQRSHEALQGEVKRLRAELATTSEQLQRSKRLAALGEMAAGIAHEVRNPLGAIGLYAELVAADLEMAEAGGGVAAPASKPVREARGNAGKITGAVRSLSAVVNDVLSFAQQVEPRTVDVPAEKLLRSAAEAAGPELAAAGVSVGLDAGGVRLRVDPDLVHRALLNLVRNAVDAMAGLPAGRPRTLRLAAGAGYLRVADSGPGIDPDAADRLFNPFFTTRSSGTGLGLAIVHRLVDAHGGAVAVENRGGAAFTLTFPES
ncbi:sensor histidine kinase [Phycisphaera mikurensis]|uniref:histidine kinase n=1 Tax=Phycisphaera mikurensis (strain NBRC 102666 / KCTC 22515 / FYK2301M01) TaxID=1142394 RepID=I0IGF0_PHYMF|nr:ATP-binding protein [Phycisphaera mikurensis]MBB6440284.1 signal transduction histidine kinase [Phycisphaera mikurensis]BAM04338.1 two-component system sensor histidine kinase [Phycisphaera mikurensis NBRC 102666]